MLEEHIAQWISDITYDGLAELYPSDKHYNNKRLS